MEVSITSAEPISAIITCGKPDIVTVVGNEPVQVVVSITKDGKDGEDGTPGKSAYQSWLELGNTGTEAEFIASLQGNDGEDAVNNTLEEVRAENPTIEGNIDAAGNTIINIRNAVAEQEPITKAQADAQLAEAKAYADTVSADTVRWAGFWNASTGSYPTGSGIRRGDEYEVSVAGTIGAVEFEVGDLLRARINSPGQTSSNWSVAQGNVQQATETRQGSARIAVGDEVANENSTNNADIVPPRKLWQNFWPRVLNLSWTWNARQIFGTAPRLSSLNPSNYLRVNATRDIEGVASIPAADVVQTDTHRFVTLAQLNSINSATREVYSDIVESIAIFNTLDESIAKIYSFNPGDLPGNFLDMTIWSSRTGASASYVVNVRANTLPQIAGSSIIASSSTGNFSPEMKFDRQFYFKNNEIRNAVTAGFQDNNGGNLASRVRANFNKSNQNFLIITITNSNNAASTIIDAVQIVN